MNENASAVDGKLILREVGEVGVSHLYLLEEPCIQLTSEWERHSLLCSEKQESTRLCHEL